MCFYTIHSLVIIAEMPSEGSHKNKAKVSREKNRSFILYFTYLKIDNFQGNQSV